MMIMKRDADDGRIRGKDDMDKAIPQASHRLRALKGVSMMFNASPNHNMKTYEATDDG